MINTFSRNFCAVVMAILLAIPSAAIDFHSDNAPITIRSPRGSREGVVSSFVRQVMQDHKGIIWAATDYGVARYDGYNFENFDKGDGLPSDPVNCLIEAKDHTIYAGAIAGLCYKSLTKFIFVTDEASGNEIHGHVTSMCKNKAGTIFASTSGGGLWQITSRGKAKMLLSEDADSKFTQAITIDPYGNIWAVTERGGIICGAPVKDKPSMYKVIKKYKVPGNALRAYIVCDSRGNIYAGYIGGGVFLKRTTDTEFQSIASTSRLSVNFLMMRSDNSLYIGTDGEGVKVLNTIDLSISTPNILCRDFNAAATKVQSMMIDRDGNLWLALFQKGIYTQTKQNDVFKTIGAKQGTASIIGDACVMAIFKHSDGTLWISTDRNGLYAINNDGTLRRHYAPGEGSTSCPPTVLTMAEDANHKLWIGSYTDGWGWFDTQSGVYHRSEQSYKSGQSVFDIRADKAGRLWIGTLGDGLKCYNVNDGSIKEYYSLYKGKNQLVNNYVLQMELSDDGRLLFVGTATGLSCLDTKTGDWTKTMGTDSLLRSEQIKGIKYSQKYGLWIGSSQGLFHFDLKTKELKKYGAAEGLPSDHISAIEIDKQGRIWVSTNRGLGYLNPSTMEVGRYYVSDGLQGNEYSEGASLMDRNGIMYFCGIFGMSYFNPDMIKKSNKKLEVTLMQMYIGDMRVRGGMKSGNFVICDTLVRESSRFDLSHQHNTITLRFSTLTYSSTDRIIFSYCINDGKWIDLKPGQNELTLGSLQPGNYNFKIVANDNGIKSPVKEFLVVIHNPWYFTPFARFIYLLIIILSIYYYIHEQKKSNRQKMLIQEHKHAEELNEQKLQFFINISHEIRTPMTLITTPLQQLIKDDDDTHRQSIYTIMKRNADRILQLVNQIMDIRKIDKGQMQMQMQQTELVSFTDNVLSLFQSQADSRSIALTLKHSGIDKIDVWIDRANFDKVLVNLLSNAVKYTDNGGNIDVTITTSEKNLSISVFNTGENIPEHDIEHIFRRFYQTNSATNRSKSGTGVGLDLARSIMALHHGSIEVKNVEGGVVFTISLPLGYEHLTQEEILQVAEEPEESTNAEKTTEQQPSDEEQQETEKETTVAPRTPSKKPTVVIVEDDDEIRSYLVAELTSNYRTMSFSNGAEALPAILREIPQLIISDIMMPEMDGNTLCAKVKSNVNTNHIPVILLTARTADEDKLESLETGADMYLTKPFNMDILRRSVANLLNTRKLMQNKYTGMEDQRQQIDDVEMESPDEKLLTRIMDVINQNLNNSDLNIEMICQKVGISRVHLHRKMKELTNQTPHDFIRNLRLKQAARLLERKGQSITEVLYHCGFNSATSFSTMFKKMYGMTPREYQKAHENDER